MELVSVFLKIGGDLNNVIHKKGITVAEAKVLYELHGGETDDPIQSIEVVDDVVVDAKDLKQYLVSRYRAKPEYMALVERVFPGARPNFLETVDDMGLPDGIPVKRKVGAKPKTKKTVEVDPLG